ncbi:MAG: hypothetical protein ACI9C1_001667, partial [Candidatus Aldehydirespiratoraceae bacterium]
MCERPGDDVKMLCRPVEARSALVGGCSGLMAVGDGFRDR